MLRLALAALVATSLLAAPAAAQPGDPLPQPLSPVDGAAVPANADGITLTFTCPAYRSSPADEMPSTDLAGYGVRVSRDPSGASSIGASPVTRSASDPSQCTSVAQDRSSDTPLNETPGTYYWFVDRTCFCGAADTEAGPSTTFTVTAPAPKLRAKALKRAYAGYTIRVTLATDLRDGQPVVLQRRSGKTWKAVPGPGGVVSDGAADTEVTLPKGKQRLRWATTRGKQTDAGAPVTVDVVKARRWSTTRRDDGAYAGPKGLPVTFEVAKGGRELRGFRAAVSVYCVGSPDDVSKNYFVTSFAAVKKIRVAPDGRFLVVAEISRTTAIVSGRLRKGKVTGGKVSLAYPLCVGGRTFKAAKR